MPDPHTTEPSPDGPAISRRDVLVGALGAAAAGGFIATAGSASAEPLTRVARPKASPHPVYRRSRFAPGLRAVVPVAEVAGARLRLESIGDIPDGRGGVAAGHEYAFSLGFRQVNGPNLAQGTYTLAFAGRGPVSLFLVPVGRPERRRYEAIVNRLTSA